ncbi:hypothetical protein ACJROX_21750 [Pseudalkalibacillus sp. A8]|uniref:hypothetical protein n=1 Tax=Pseudalkalibacillus sp. A8 TaxID=3382641 RepID=UPI0038B5D35D
MFYKISGGRFYYFLVTDKHRISALACVYDSHLGSTKLRVSTLRCLELLAFHSPGVFEIIAVELRLKGRLIDKSGVARSTPKVAQYNLKVARPHEEVAQ